MKELKVRRLPNGMAFEVYMEGGGPVPQALQGMYTHISVAEQAIRTFQAGVQSRVEQSGKGKQ